MSKQSGKINTKQRLFLARLLEAPTITEAAQEAGISPATAARWLKHERFQEEFREAKERVVSQTLARIQQASGEAISILLAIARDTTKPASPRVAACRAILDLAVRAHEVDAIESRLAALEVKVGLM